MSARRRSWHWIRRVWATLGILAVLGFSGWSLVAYRASGDARTALISDDRVGIVRGANHWLLTPAESGPRRVGLVFFPGALVEPAAYAPLLRSIALAGYPVLLVELPRRGAFGGADGPEVIARARRAMLGAGNVSEWAVGGHSRGGAVAARFVRDNGAASSGLLLVGTSHPRDFSLADSRVPVTKILGTRDGIAPIGKSEENRHLLPATSTWVLIDGGNHSQFGWYGFQPGDYFASIDRGRQQELTRRAIVDMLDSAARRSAPADDALQPTGSAGG